MKKPMQDMEMADRWEIDIHSLYAFVQNLNKQSIVTTNTA
jgi:hypothetical protein